MTTFIFSVVLWDETGNNLLESFDVKIRRTKIETARNWVKTKYPQPYFVELKSTAK